MRQSTTFPSHIGDPAGCTLHIKNMVCPRCILVVRQQLESLGLAPRSVELGSAVLEQPLTDTLRRNVRQVLEPLGFELLEDKRIQLAETIKTTLIRLVRDESLIRVNLSDYLTDKLHRDYGSLSKLFSEMTHTTIEKYFIAQRIEFAKELLKDNELTLAEIAQRLHYSSTAYLSSQFKSITGMTPSRFRQSEDSKRKPIDQVTDEIL